MKHPVALLLVTGLIIVLKGPSNCSLNLRLQKSTLKSEILSPLHLKLFFKCAEVQQLSNLYTETNQLLSILL